MAPRNGRPAATAVAAEEEPPHARLPAVTPCDDQRPAGGGPNGGSSCISDRIGDGGSGSRGDGACVGGADASPPAMRLERVIGCSSHPGACAVAAHPDASLVYCAGGTLVLYDIAARRQARFFGNPGGAGRPFACAAVSRCGQTG
eukprot:365979-Chlamydomonas_euryale.AAC.1